MNIFVLDNDPKKCAEAHCNKHVVKMILEHAQLMCTAHHLNKMIIKRKKTAPDVQQKQKNYQQEKMKGI